MRALQSAYYPTSYDPIVLLHAQALLTSATGGVTSYLDADLRDPQKIFTEAAETLDFGQPMAVLLLGILHNIGDEYDPYGLVRTLTEAVPGGSYLAICHDHAQVTSFFDGLELVEPGVVQLSKWRPRSELESAAAAALWGGVARKPA